LWGSAAATRYSIKGETDTALWRQPSTSEVFNLFNKDIVNETIRNYPVHRAIKVMIQLFFARAKKILNKFTEISPLLYNFFKIKFKFLCKYCTSK